ncbi:MAG: thioredoxin domain-containing protein [Candidatus Dojkabacteria bacterium]|nr:MAG: thioredoxin domain-containing protein [Candidatus Dojkabacteria bacterium]
MAEQSNAPVKGQPAQSASQSKQTKQSHTAGEENVVSIDVQQLLTPVAILLAGMMVSGTLYFSLNDSTGSSSKTLGATDKTTTTTTGTTVEVDSDVSVTLSGYAEEIGVDMDEYDKCVAANDTSEVDADTAAGTSAGVSGTPGFIIGKLSDDGTVEGYRISGAYPYGDFQTILSALESGDTPAPKYDFNQDGTLDAWPTGKTSLDDDAYKGNKDDAQYAIVEFSDFECPFCQRHYQQTYSSIIDGYVDNGKAVYAFRDFPLSFHPKAVPAAVAANCVMDQKGAEGYFQMHDKIFGNGI